MRYGETSVMKTPDSIPENFLTDFFGRFEQSLASELIQLVDEAHKRYDDVYPSQKLGKWWEFWKWSQQRPQKMFDHTTSAPREWSWQTETEPSFEINGSKFIVLSESNLIFTQLIWYLPFSGFKRKVPFGFVAKCIKTSDIYIVFRGTMNLGEWISNFKVFQIPLGSLDLLNWRHVGKARKELNTTGEVHLGFYRTYTRPKQNWWIDKFLLKDVKALSTIVEEVLKRECPPTSAMKPQIYVTGHSLGGALATLAANHIGELIKNNKISALPPILYSFASPRVGDVEFARNFSVESYRIANSEDVVPKIPLLLSFGISLNVQSTLDYQHVGIPIYFTIQKRTIQDNHIMPTYLGAFGINSAQSAIPQR